MPREIKFRGKREDTGEWVYGSLSITKKYQKLPAEYYILSPCGYVQTTNFDPHRNMDKEWYRDYINYQVILETVGQFTGLRDKNGKEIYEGDIVHYWQSIDGRDGTGFHRNLVVDGHETGPLFRVIGLGEWEGPYTVYKMAEMLTPRPFYNVRGNLKVIGNVHENPELLKEEAK